MKYQEAITTGAGRDAAWAALSTVESWPRWTTSMTSVQPLDGPDLRVGRRWRVRQPGLPVVVWRVSDLTTGQSFAWEASSPGLHTIAYHRLSTDPDGSTRITIGIDQTGPLAGLVDAMIGRRTRRYLALEAAGLKAASEAVRQAQG